ncbi:hypothetical protein QTP86_015535 [Hemibagrus guttatus]|nr:hypothetical protein QTP86_015535 [Hemibagrus guttatus]
MTGCQEKSCGTVYERSRTVVRCAVGQTEEFKVEVGLHQGSALSPFLFAMVMDQLSEEVRQESPWTMMFADNIVICSESREQVEENLERWRFALERRGMKVSRSKTEYMCVNEREGSGTVRLQGEEVKKVQEFKYLGSTVQSNGECGKEVKKRVQAGWNGWRKVSGVLCDRKISARIKGKVYKTVVRPAMLYGLETVSLRKRQESELEVAELKMLRFSLGVTRLDRIRNEYIRGTAHVGHLGDKVREARLRWFGHVQRRESEYIGRRMLDMELPGRRQRGRPKRRYMDVINEDMKLVGASVEDAEDRDRRREMILFSKRLCQLNTLYLKLHLNSLLLLYQNLPFTGCIQGSLFEGKTVTVSGRVLAGAESDIALHFNPRYVGNSGHVVCNTLQNSCWGSEQKTKNTPLPRGSDFTLTFLVNRDSYSVIVNGTHFLEYLHRLPVSRVNAISVDGGVEIVSIAFQNPSLTINEKHPEVQRVQSKVTRGSGWNMQRHQQHESPIQAAATWSLAVSRTFILAEIFRFSINLRYNSGIALHFNPRFNENVVVRNSLLKECWGKEEKNGGMPFYRGQQFTVIKTSS